MSMISKLPEESLNLVVNEASNTYSELTELVRTGTTTVRDYLRKLLNVSATSVSFAVVGLLGYAVYRSYKYTHSNFRNGDYNDYSVVYEADPDIGKAKRPLEDLEEVIIQDLLFNLN